VFSNRSLSAWRFVHTWSSLICTLFLFELCITGLPLIFQDELSGAFSSTRPVASSAPLLSLDKIAALARTHYPRDVVRSLFIDDDAPQVYAVLGRSATAPEADNHYITLDQHTGQLLNDQRKPGDSVVDGVLSFMLELHANLFLGVTGDFIVAAIGLVFLAAMVSGIVLYAPFARRAAFGTVRREGSSRLRWLDLHNVLGIVTAAWLVVVGLTGVLNALATPLFGLWEITDVQKVLAGYGKQAVVTPTLPIEDAAQIARRALPGSTVSGVTMPTHGLGSPVHYAVWMKGASTLTSRMTTFVLVDARTGRDARVLSLPGYLRAVEISRPLHFGDYGGMPLKVIWALFDVVAIVVLGSGLYLWVVNRIRAGTRVASSQLLGAV
jgi:uncharacterized iron-regulated membrane protein